MPIAQPPGSDTRASWQRANSGPSTSTEARILRTMSYGASVELIAPPSDRLRPSLPTGSTAMPCCDSRLVMVSISASRGTLVSTSR